jgi:metal-responsive CopG/Arc/MetJ family transcriptional regulator
MEIAMVTQTSRLSATVPKHIIDEADEIAALDGVSRSQLISRCLTEMIQRRRKALLAEGYRAMAKQHEGFVSLSEGAAKEVLPNW